MATEVQQFDPDALKGASRDDLLDLAMKIQLLQNRASQIGPQNDDELHALILEKYGMWVPRIAVDPTHDAPFSFVADVYFNRYTAVFVVAGRESAKTSMVAMIHALKARFFPGYEGITAGAVEAQSKRAYISLKRFNEMWGSDIVESSLQSVTLWLNGSRVEVIGGTPASLNGPHSNLLHRDELELFDGGNAFHHPGFDEGDNITKSGVTKDGRAIPAQDILTTSLKRASGLAQQIIDECKRADEGGYEAPYKIYRWGVAETIANQPTCREAPENHGKLENQLCQCHLLRKGTWDDGTPRTLDKVCLGRFYKADGWRPKHDIDDKFLKNSRRMWDMQQESQQSSSETLMLPNFSDTRNGLIGWDPDPDNGESYMGVDFGGRNAHCAIFYQLTNKPLPGLRKKFEGDQEGESVIIPEGSLVAYDEVYVSEVGNVTFGNMTIRRMIHWENLHPGWKIEEIYADIAAKSARLDWANSLERPLRSVWRIQRDIEEHVTLFNERIEDDMFYVSVDRCPMLIAECLVWERDPKTGKQIDTFNHAISGARYCIANLHRKIQIEQKKNNSISNGPVAATATADRDSDNPLNVTPATGPSRSSYVKDDPFNDVAEVASSPGPMGRLF